MDEAALELEPVLRKCWMRRGEQRRIPTPPARQPSLHLFGGLNWRSKQVAYQLAGRRHSESFIAWLEHLMGSCYPTQFVVLVLDNARFHKSLATQAACALYEARLLLVFLPPYAPHLNPIERFWRHLKDRVCADRLYGSLQALEDAVVKELERQNDLSTPGRYGM